MRDKFLILSLLLFSLLFLPFVGSLPYLDGNVDFIRSYNFYSGGIEKYFQNEQSVHPPLKLFLTNILFNLNGLSAYTYTLLGFLSGIVGIIAIFKLCEVVFGKKIARISSILLATSPLFLATGIFALNDYLLTILILLTFYYYAKKQHFYASLIASAGVLTKEPGILLPISILIIEFGYFVKRLVAKQNVPEKTKFHFYFLPLLVAFLWALFTRISGQQSWNDWNFSLTADKGSLYTVINNLITFNFLNKYAYQNWLQLLFLNFQWVYFLLILFGLIIFLGNKNDRKAFIKAVTVGNIRIKTTLSMALFFWGFLLTVLSFQTYTIPRYGLPLIPFLLIGVAVATSILTAKWPILKMGMVGAFFILTLGGLFSSLDPLASRIWGKTEVLGEKIYALNEHLAGNDGITYNMQYMFIIKKRTKQILSVDNPEKSVFSNECHWIFPDPNNDYKTIIILQLKNLDPNFPCRNT